MSGYIATSLATTYAASKVYDLFLAEGLGYELSKDGVDVLALCPGSTATEFHQVAGLQPVAAMAVQPVVQSALKQLGKKRVVITGSHNRFSVWLLKLTPRSLHVPLAGRVMERRITP